MMNSVNPPIDPSEVELDLLKLPRLLSWEEAFGNGNPVELDIGCGRGRFIIEAAQARPNVNYLGIDVSGKSLRLAKERIAKRGIQNAKTAWADARRFIAERVADESLEAAHLLFPDPWPKSRHRKRRVATPEFAAQLRRALGKGRPFHVATDIADYFDELLEAVASDGHFEIVSEDLYDPERHFLTNFAAKYLEQGREMHYARLRSV